MVDNLTHPYTPVVTIDMLPDDVLLDIFAFWLHGYQVQVQSSFVVGYLYAKRRVESWQTLIHVCRRWRDLVFESPRRLDLRLCCSPGKSARISLDIWPPALPLVIVGNGQHKISDDFAYKLKHGNRISHIHLTCCTNEQIKNVLAAMQVPFPELEVLHLSNAVPSFINTVLPVLPDSFLGGSAPRLRILSFKAISFPGLPNLLLSATHLVKLCLIGIHHSEYISPEAMVTCLSMLTSLEEIYLEFEPPQPPFDQENRRSPPPTRSRSILPALIIFEFKGENKYLQDLVSCIDTPRLHQLSTTLFYDIDFDTSEFNQFLIRTPTLGAYDEAHLVFRRHEALLSLHQFQLEPDRSPHERVDVTITSSLSGQLSSLTQMCTLSLRSFLTMEDLYICEDPISPPYWKANIENTKWLDFLRPFSAVKNLYLPKRSLSHIAPALQELTGGRIADVFPTLKNVFLEGFQPSEPVQEGVAQFVFARQLTDHPVTISVWDNVPLLVGIGYLSR